jgi:hypothetical protein
MSTVDEVQSLKLFASSVNRVVTSCCPKALRHAPRTLTGSLRDQSARLGAESPLWSASSASASVVLNQFKNSS